mgnify:CR=1 FL=1
MPAEQKTLKIDLSEKTPQEIADFLSTLLAVRRTLLKKGLDIRILPKTRKVLLSNTQEEEE